MVMLLHEKKKDDFQMMSFQFKLYFNSKDKKTERENRAMVITVMDHSLYIQIYSMWLSRAQCNMGFYERKYQ